MSAYRIHLRLLRIRKRIDMRQVLASVKRVIAYPFRLTGNVYLLKLFAVHETAWHYLKQILLECYGRKLRFQSVLFHVSDGLYRA
jgi:hypothetical protein